MHGGFRQVVGIERKKLYRDYGTAKNAMLGDIYIRGDAGDFVGHSNNQVTSQVFI
jgi:hypothetical protein